MENQLQMIMIKELVVQLINRFDLQNDIAFTVTNKTEDWTIPLLTRGTAQDLEALEALERIKGLPEDEREAARLELVKHLREQYADLDVDKTILDSPDTKKFTIYFEDDGDKTEVEEFFNFLKSNVSQDVQFIDVAQGCDVRQLAADDIAHLRRDLIRALSNAPNPRQPG